MMRQMTFLEAQDAALPRDLRPLPRVAPGVRFYAYRGTFGAQLLEFEAGKMCGREYQHSRWRFPDEERWHEGYCSAARLALRHHHRAPAGSPALLDVMLPMKPL